MSSDTDRRAKIDEMRRGAVKDLTDWANPPTVSDLKNDYTEARTSHSTHVANVDLWLNNLNGELKVKVAKGRSKVQPKLIRKQAEWRYAALSEPFLSTDDMFDVHPITFEDKEASVQNSLVLNKQFNVDIDKVDFVDEYVRTGVDEGTIIVKVGWETFEEEVEEEVEVPVYASPEESMQYLQAMVQSGQMPLEEAEAMIAEGQPVQIDTKLEMQTVVKEVKNSPTLDIRDYRNVIIDPSCQGKIENAQFIIDKFTTTLSDLKKDGRYSNLEGIVPSDNAPSTEEEYAEEDGGFTFSDKPRQKLVAYEYWGYWDIDDTGIVKAIKATFVGDTMIELIENPFPDKKLPFVVVSYLPKRRSVYGEPDGSLLEDNQDIIGATTRGIIDLMGRSANAQQGIRKDALDVANFRKFEKGEDYKFNPNIDPRTAFYMHDFPEIPRSALELINLQNTEAESLTGVKAFTGGISGNALGDNVGGIRSALDATAKRELGILRRLSKGIKEIGRKIIAMNAEFLNEEEVIRITNDQFVPVRRDDLAGNFDLRLSISTAEADNEKAQELAFMQQTMGNSQDPEISKMIQVEIARLRKMPDLAKRIEEYQPQPDPVAQKMQALQIAKLEAEVFNEQQKGLENQIDVELKRAKTAVEQAKARALHSDSDNKDLDFTEKVQGVTHNKEMEKEELKAQNKVDVKMLEGLSKASLENSRI